MSGIVFLKTQSLEKITNFYLHQLNMKLWLTQLNCNILQSDQMLIGFLQSDQAETQGVITFFYKTKEEVDHYYELLKVSALHPPQLNEKYQIYHFYAKDPEGRKIEFQTFMHELNPFESGEVLLKNRRSIRQFTQKPIDKEILNKIFELCKFAPTSRNSQSFYFVVIEDQSKKLELSAIRENASKPIANAPLCVAVVADASKTLRKEQDACIAATYLLLSAHLYGLGTCWITDMDRLQVKQLLDIPEDHYIACITPLAYPVEYPNLPQRRDPNEFVYWK